jgi:putative transposase
MARKKRHTAAEITAKLDEAKGLEQEGRTQKEIARALGVSLMTFHRWRKLKPKVAVSRSANTALLGIRSGIPITLPKSKPSVTLAELTLENTRLRKIVTDLLLERIKLEEDVQQFQGGRRERVLLARSAG